MAERVDREMKWPKSELFGKLENGDDASRSHSWLSNVAYVSREERARGRVCKVEVVWWKEEEFGAAGRACRTCPRCGGGGDGGGDCTPVDMVGAGGACTVVATSECICASERSVRAREQSRSAAESRCRLDGEDKPDCSAVAVAVERRRVSEYCMD